MTTRRFLVTGASKGIGLALSRRLSDLGHRVVGLARNPACDFPGDLVQVDLADRVATAAALEGIVSRGAIDGVVNNVGLVRPQPLGKIDLDDLSAFSISTCVLRFRRPRPLCRRCRRPVGVAS